MSDEIREQDRVREIRELAQLLADIKRRTEYSPLELAEALYQRGVRIPTGYPLRRLT
jgi:hypothetical protein